MEQFFARVKKSRPFYIFWSTSTANPAWLVVLFTLNLAGPQASMLGHMGGLINPRPGRRQYRAGFSNTDGSPKPRKRAPCQKSPNVERQDLCDTFFQSCWPHWEVYRNFQPSLTSSSGGAKGFSDHRFRAPPAYTAQLLTLHQHRAKTSKDGWSNLADFKRQHLNSHPSKY